MPVREVLPSLLANYPQTRPDDGETGHADQAKRRSATVYHERRSAEVGHIYYWLNPPDEV